MPMTAHTVTAQGAGQGLDPRVAKAHGCSSPPVGGDRRVRDPLEDWMRKDAGLAGTFSVQQPGVDRTRAGVNFIEVVPAALAPDVVGVVDDGLDPQRAAVCRVGPAGCPADPPQNRACHSSRHTAQAIGVGPAQVAALLQIFELGGHPHR